MRIGFIFRLASGLGWISFISSAIASRPPQIRLSSEEKIQGLTWEKVPLKFEPLIRDGSLGAAIFQGHTQGLEDASIIATFDMKSGREDIDRSRTKRLNVSKDGTVLLSAPIIDSKSYVSLTVIDSYGKVSSDEITISYSIDQTPEDFRADLNVGPSLFAYQEQSGNSNFLIKSAGIKTKGSLSYSLKPSWLIGVEAYIVEPLFSTSLQPPKIKPPQLYGLSGWVEHPLEIYSKLNQLLFRAGYYGTGMILAGAPLNLTYGVRNSNGPQVALIYESNSDATKKYTLGLKYGLIKNEWSVTPSNCELALAGRYLLGPVSFLPGHSLSLVGGLARTNFTQPYQTFALTVLDLAVSLSL